MPVPGNRLRRSILVALAGVIASLSCGREITGPDGGPIARGFTFDIRFPPVGGADVVASDIVPFSQVRVVLRNLAGEITVNRVIDFPSTADTVELELSVPLPFNAPSTGAPMDLSLAFANAAGDTVFRAGPVQVLVVPANSATQPPPPPVLEPIWVGPGSSAERVVIAPDGASLTAGDAFSFTATAFDAQNAPVVDAPVGWYTLDLDKATIPDDDFGNGVTLPSRGTARIVAFLANGKADTVLLAIAPKAGTVVKVSGDAQTAPASTMLSAPAVARVDATDGLPMSGVAIDFAAGALGSVGTPSAVSDGNGLVQTTWTLGPNPGAQQLTASVQGVPAIATTFNATATAAAVTLLHHYPMTGNVNDAVGTAHGTLVGGASMQDGVLSLDGSGEYVQFATHLVPSAGSYTVAFFLRSRMSSAITASYISQGQSGQPGFSIGHQEGGLSGGEGWPFTGEPAPGPDGLYHHLVLAVDAVAGSSRLYVDGVLQQTLASAIPAPAGGTDTRLGRTFDPFANYFTGEMDELRIYSGALNASEVAALHDAGPTTLGRLVFQQQPANSPAGATLTPNVIVRVEDAMGRLRTTFNGNVALSVATGPGTLNGGTTVAAVNGIATFSSVFINTAGTYTLQADMGGGVTAVSTPFDVIPAATTALAFVQDPTTAAPGVAIAPPISVRARDAFGNTATGFTGNITIALNNNPTGATLGGTTTVAAVAGVATFSDITVSLAGTGYTLIASSSGLSGAGSAAFNVVSGGPTVIQWTNAAGGSWNTPANWDLGRVPNATDSVVIGLAGTYSVAFGGSVTVANLTIGDNAGVRTLAMSTSSVLTVTGTLTLRAGSVIAVNGASIAGPGLLWNEGTLGANTATLSIAVQNFGLYRVEDVVSQSGALLPQPGSTLRIQGSSAYGAATMTVANGFYNAGTIELTSVGSGFNSQLTVTAGTLGNAPGGTIVALPGVGGSRTLAAQLYNEGTVTVSTALTIAKADADHVNVGTISVSGANLAVTQSGTTPTFSNAGAVAIGSGRTFSVSGGALALTGGTVDGYAGTLSTSSTSLTFTVPEARTRLALGAGTVIPSAFTVPAGDSLRLVTGTFTAPNLVVDGAVIAEDVVGISSTLTVTATASIIVRGTPAFGAATLTVANGFANNGTIDLTSTSGFNSTLDVTTGTLLNAPSGTILSSVGAGGSRTLGAQIDNQGTITVNNTLTLAKASATQLNNGTINVVGANLTVTSSGTLPRFENRGPINLSSGRVLSVSGGVTDLTSGTITGYAGTLSTSSTNLFFTVPSARTRLSFGAGTVIPSAFTVPAGDSIRLVTGTFTAPTLQNDGQLIAEDVVGITSAIATGAGSAIIVRGTPAFGAATLTIANGFLNSATIDLTSTSGFNSTLAVTSGSLTNASAGTILSSVGAGGGRILAVELVNQGTVTVNNTLTLARADAAHVNSGAIAIAGANLTVTQTGTTPSFVNTGAITLSANRTLSVTGGALDLTGGTVSGYGATLATSSTTLTFTVPEARTRLALGAGTAIPAAFTIPAGDSLRLITGTFAAPTLQNDGQLIAEDVVGITSGITTGTGSEIIIRGTPAFGAASLTVANGFTNSATIDLTSTSGFNSTLTVTAGTLVNASAGTILSSVGAGGARILAAQLDNQGLVTVNTTMTLARADADHLNSGTIAVTGANLTLTQSGTTPTFANTGAITLAANRTMTVTGGELILTGGTLSGYGATLATSSTTLTFTVPEARTRLALGAATVIPAAFTIPSADSLRLITGTFTAPTLQNDGQLIAEDVVGVTSAITTGAGSAIIVRGTPAFGAASLTVANGFTNTETIDLTSTSGFNSTLTVTAGTLVNAPTGTILSSAGAGGARILAAQLDNQGTVTVNTTFTLARADADHLNSGVIAVAGANMTLTQSGANPTFANTGSIVLSANRTLTVTGGELVLTGGTLSGYGGSLATSSTTLTFTVPEARTRLALGAGTAIPAAFTVPAGDSLRLITGTFAAPTLQNDGNVIAEDVVAITSAVTTGTGSQIIVRGTPAFGAATLTIANGFTNSATIDLTSTSGFNSTLAVTTGTLVNAPSGTIVSSAGAGGARILAAQLDNQGLVTVNTTFTLARADADHLNSGTIDVAGANFTLTQSGTTPTFANTGTITVGNNRSMTATGGALILTGGTLSGYGGSLATSSTSLTFTVPEARTRLALGAGTAIPAAFTIPAGDSLRLITGTFAAPTLQVDGRLVAEDVVGVTSAITTGAGSAIVVRGTPTFGAATLTVANGFTNIGTIDLTSTSGFNSTLAVTAGTLVNAPAGTILSAAGAGGSRTVGAQLDNQGLVTVNAPLVLAFAGADHLNSGTIDVAGNNFQVTQSGTTPSFANSGAINLTAGRTFTNSNGTLDLTGGTVSGYASTLVATGTTTLVFTVPQARTRLQLGTGTIIPGTFTVPAGDSLRLVTGSFTAPTLVLDGRLVVEDVVTVTSAITTGLPSDTAIVVRGTATFGAATLNVSNTFVNTGIIHLTSTSGFNSTLNVTGGLVNASGALLLASLGGGGSRTIGGPINQNGLLTVNATTLSLGGLLQLNPGSTSTVIGGGTLVTSGGCTNNGGTFSGFLCP